MSTVRHENVRTEPRDGGVGALRSWDGIPARIFLQPVAAPSVLGLFGFGAATFMVAANLAGWPAGDDPGRHGRREHVRRP